MSFTLRVQNYRGLRKVEWRPEGVCALVGPNASGKTTLLDVPQMLGDALERGMSRAFETHGGLDAVRAFAAPEDEPIRFDIAVDDISWSLAPAHVTQGFRPEEKIHREGRIVLNRRTGEDEATISDARGGESTVYVRESLATALALATHREFEPLERLVTRYRMYGLYHVDELRRHGSDDTTERRLNRRGSNVFSLLRNWRDRREDATQRYAFVLDGLRQIFPDFFDDLEFSKSAQIVGAELRLRPYDRRLPASLAPDGWFVALLHLAALASTDEGDVIAIDEPENALHPRAIKALLPLMREWSKRRGVTVLLATHSPVIIDAFRECPDKLYVMEPGREVLPVALSELHDRDWLAHFALGDLYTHEEFGAPQRHDDDDRADHHRPV